MLRIRHYSLKENVLSLVLGCIIGAVIAVIAAQSRNDRNGIEHDSSVLAEVNSAMLDALNVATVEAPLSNVCTIVPLTFAPKTGQAQMLYRTAGSAASTHKDFSDVCPNSQAVSDNLQIENPASLLDGKYITSYEELELFARLLDAEAENQGEEGKRYVASTVLNRVDSDEFPNTVTEVILQYNPWSDTYQFAPVGSGRIDEMRVTEENIDIVLSEVSERTDWNVMYFSSEGYLPYGEPYAKIGDHYFNY